MQQPVADRSGAGGQSATRRSTWWQAEIQAQLEPDRSYRVAINDFLLTGKELGLAFLTPSHPSLQLLGDRGEVRQRLIQHLQASS